MVGSPKSNLYVTVTSEQGKKQHKLDQVWMISVEPQKHHFPGLPHKDPEPIHYSAVYDGGAYFINSHPLANESDLSGNILLVENAKVAPQTIRDLLDQHLQSSGQTPDCPDYWIRQALVIFQSNGLLDNINVDDFMDFAHTYATKRANHEAPAMIPYHKVVPEPEKKVRKHNFWVTYPMESNIKPKESRVEDDTDAYGGLM